MGQEKHTVAVLAPVLYLTVTIETTSTGADEVHIHPGGQGFWIARMLKHLDERPLLCGPLGGEAGKVFMGLVSQWGVDVSPIEVAHRSPVVINDRRSGVRETIALSPGVALERHEVDDIYGRFLDHSLTSGVGVITGQSEEIFAKDFYRRLGNDLESGQVRVVADLHGPELWAFLEGGSIEILKVSDEDLQHDGLITDPDEKALTQAIRTLTDAGARSVVLSRQGEPALARFGDTWYEARSPALDPADHHGAGDSMTAGLAAALRRSLLAVDALRLACAAGAANVTRHGLGSADTDLIPGLTEKVDVRELTPTPL